MKKILLLTIPPIFIFIVYLSFSITVDSERIKAASIQKKTDYSYKLLTSNKVSSNEDMSLEMFILYGDNELYKEFSNLEEAINCGKLMKNASIKEKGKAEVIWDNYLPYDVFVGKDTYQEFETFKEAVDYGRKFDHTFIYHRKDNSLIWSNADPLKESYKIKRVPIISQFPQLPRGCEVTSLCMLLNYKGIKADKMTLASEIKKDTTPSIYKDGKFYSGNPNNGFIGSMTNLDDFGLGVYHKPIFNLLQEYAPRQAIDLTGAKLEDLFYLICGDTPIWVIINDKYAPLPPTFFETWDTPDGEIKVTYNEHSVLVTGYDKEYIYFNDPLGEEIKAKRKDFEAAFIQMGSQAVTMSN